VRRVRLSLAATLAATLMLAAAGCGGDDKESTDEAAPQGTGQGAVLESTWPLTGLPVSGDQSAEKTHPVFVVKIDNTSSSAPQIGLGDADMVVEELVEGGSTRLAAFFYSKIPANAGPVRSMRASDIGIVKPVDAQMVTSGAAAVTIGRLQKAGVKFYGEGSKGMYRDSSRSAPYNLFVKLQELAKSVEVDAARPDDYLPWGDAEDLPKGRPAKTIAASFSGGHTTDWTFRGGTYENTNSNAASGDRFLADNVLVLRVKVGDAGYRDPAGNPVPETHFTGTGAAMLFHDGRLVRGTWSKQGLDSPLKLKTRAGELTVPAGRTFIELVPTGNGGNVTFTKK
jgi:hypothetical protein